MRALRVRRLRALGKTASAIARPLRAADRSLIEALARAALRATS